MRKWVIQDWAGNFPYGKQEFDSFDDAWALIRETHPEEDWQEFYVVPKGSPPGAE